MCAVSHDYFLVQKHTVLARSSSQMAGVHSVCKKADIVRVAVTKASLLGIRLQFQPAHQWQSHTKHQGHAWCLDQNKET